MDILQTTNLTKRFGEFTAVDSVTFSLKEGEILGLLGPNGAGKTTIIQMLLGVLTPTSGKVIYFGEDLQSNRSEILEHVNFSSTYTNLPWDLRVYENLNYIAHLYDIKDRKKRVEKIIGLFRLEELRNHRISELSAGQVTRVNLAKAFLNQPKVLLLDEPTASLDPDVAAYIREFLLEERERFQVSIVFTSHNMAEVEELCDRVIFINQGRIIADDTPENLARSVEVCHIKLLFRPGSEERLAGYCKGRNLEFRKEDRHVAIDLKEKEIADFLRDLNQQGMVFDEISIDKPSLEDYFLANAAKGKA